MVDKQNVRSPDGHADDQQYIGEVERSATDLAEQEKPGDRGNNADPGRKARFFLKKDKSGNRNEDRVKSGNEARLHRVVCRAEVDGKLLKYGGDKQYDTDDKSALYGILDHFRRAFSREDQAEGQSCDSTKHEAQTRKGQRSDLGDCLCHEGKSPDDGGKQ